MFTNEFLFHVLIYIYTVKKNYHSQKNLLNNADV